MQPECQGQIFLKVNDLDSSIDISIGPVVKVANDKYRTELMTKKTYPNLLTEKTYPSLLTEKTYPSLLIEKTYPSLLQR